MAWIRQLSLSSLQLRRKVLGMKNHATTMMIVVLMLGASAVPQNVAELRAKKLDVAIAWKDITPFQSRVSGHLF